MKGGKAGYDERDAIAQRLRHMSKAWSTTALMILATTSTGCSTATTSSAAAKAATAFFQTVARDGAAQAYASTTPAFRHDWLPNGWQATVQLMYLDHFQDVVWNASERQDDGSIALGGTLYAAGSLPLPVEVGMAKGDDGAWHMTVLHLKGAPVTRLGETLYQSGITHDTLTIPATEVARSCSGPGTPIQALVCTKAIRYAVGATDLCAGQKDGRVIGVQGRLVFADTVNRQARFECSILDAAEPAPQPLGQSL